METWWFSITKESTVREISWQSYGNSFWDAEEMLLIGYLPKDETIHGVYYAELLHQKDNKIIKMPVLRNNKIICHQENARIGSKGEN